jgi:hypothetical protein
LLQSLGLLLPAEDYAAAQPGRIHRPELVITSIKAFRLTKTEVALKDYHSAKTTIQLPFCKFWIDVGAEQPKCSR